MPARELVLDDLCREAQFSVRATDDADGDGLTIDGIAAVFDTPTRIESWEGTFDERIAYGAFRKSVRERMPKLQFDHGHHPLIGSLPIGRWDSMVEEQGAGLHAVGRLHDNWLVEPVRDAIREQSVDGMSFRFSVVREEWRDGEGKVIRDQMKLLELLWNPDPDRGVLQRTLKEVKITEAGPVTWPAYAETSVGVRSRKVVIDLGRLNERDERSRLAEAVFLADAAARTEQDDPAAEPAKETPKAPDAPPADQAPPSEHPDKTDEKPSEVESAPPADRSSPSTHPSALWPARKPNPAKEFAKHARGYLIGIERN